MAAVEKASFIVFYVQPDRSGMALGHAIIGVAESLEDAQRMADETRKYESDSGWSSDDPIACLRIPLGKNYVKHYDADGPLRLSPSEKGVTILSNATA